MQVPNHVLPTNGTAKFFSPLSVDDFIKKSSIISYSKNALETIHTDIEKFATAEHLTAHANSIKVRFEKLIKRTGAETGDYMAVSEIRQATVKKKNK